MTDHVYALVQLKISNPDAYGERYAGPVASQLMGRGVRILAVTNEPNVVEGDYPFNSTVLLEFPSNDVFEDWYGSEEYAPLKSLRAELTDAPATRMVVLPAFPGFPE